MAKKDISNKFECTPELKYLIEHNIVYIKPWEIIFEKRLNLAYEGLKKRYPGTNLIPFAVRTDGDDVACFDLNTSEKKVVIIHDYSSVGWERREIFNTFWDWYHRAVEDMIEFAKVDIEYEQKNKS